MASQSESTRDANAGSPNDGARACTSEAARVSGDALGEDVVARLVPGMFDEELLRTLRRSVESEQLKSHGSETTRAMRRDSLKKRRRAERRNSQNARVLAAKFTNKDEVPRAKALNLTGAKVEDKRIVDASDDLEVVIHGLETSGAYKTKHKKTYVQVGWKEQHQHRRKVKTFRRENTDNPKWGIKGKFTFPNCAHVGKFIIKVKEARALGRKVVVGHATIPSSSIPRDGTKVDLRIALVTRKPNKVKVELIASFGVSNRSEPAIGENDFWGNEATVQPSDAENALERRRGFEAVIVTVVSARDVFDADFTGTSDPFVKFGFDTSPLDRRFKTSVQSQTRFPTWNERFLLRLTPDGDERAIVFTLWDKDFLSDSDFLGACAVPLDAIPKSGDVLDLDLVIKRRVTPDAAGEFCWIHPRATENLGILRVQVHALVGEDAGKVVEAVDSGKIGPSDGTALARSVHIAIVAARQLFRIDAGTGSCDAFAYVRMDNAPKGEFCRTDTIMNTLHPVWNNGIGQVFTLVSRPGCAAIVIDLFDQNLFSTRLMGRALVQLSSLPPNGSWQQIATPLYGVDKNRNMLVGGTDSSLAWNSPDRIKGELIVRVSATRSPFPNIPRPPPLSEEDRYINQHETTRYLYVQALKYEDLPIRHLAASTCVQIRMALNTHRDLVLGRVQRDVTPCFVFDSEVMVMPKTALSRTLTIQVVGQMKSLYGSATFSRTSRKAMRWLGLNRSQETEDFFDTSMPVNDDSEDEEDVIEFEDGDEKFSEGNAIGYVQIPVGDLKPGDMKRVKLKVQPMLNPKSWLRLMEDDLGEIEIMLGCGYAKVPPKDLRSVGQVARRTLGSFSMNIVSVVGDRTPYQQFVPLIDSVLSMVDENEKFGKHVYATVMWDGREENIKSSQERFNFPITEVVGDIRILIKCPDKLSSVDRILGGVSIPMTDIINSEGKSIDAWYNVTPPNSYYLKAQEMSDPTHEMCVYPRFTTRPSDWQGYVHIRASFQPTGTTAEWQWYLQQMPSTPKTSHIPDTIDGVLRSLQRAVESILTPLKTLVRATLFVSARSPASRTPKIIWVSYHTLCCLTFQSEMLSTFVLLWIVPGIFFIGYCSKFITDDLNKSVSPFAHELSDVEKLRQQVYEMARKRNRKLRKFRDELMEEAKLKRLADRGRAVEINDEAIKQGIQKRKKKRARMGINDELPTISSVLVPQNFINNAVAVLTASNPAEIVLRIIREVIWKLMKVLKNAGVTLVRIDQVISDGGPRLMPGVCSLAGMNLEKLADSLDRPVRLLTYDNVTLSKYFSLLTCSLASVACITLLLMKKALSLLDQHSPLRLWHFVWVVGISPTLPLLSDRLMDLCVQTEYIIQLTVGVYVPVQPLSVRTIMAVKESIEADFKDDYKKLRDQVAKSVGAELEAREKRAKEKADENQKRFKVRAKRNPLLWMSAALSRAPTSLTVEHARRTRALMVPGDERPPEVKMFRKDVHVGSASVYMFGKLIAFAVDVPIRALQAPMRLARASSKVRLDVSDAWTRFRAFTWLRPDRLQRDGANGKEKLPFGTCEVLVRESSRIKRSPSGTRIVDVVDEELSKAQKSAENMPRRGLLFRKKIAQNN